MINKVFKDVDWRQYTMDEEEFKIQVKGYAQKFASK